jgi:hypothetical protein
MDFTEQTVAAWAKQDSAVSARTTKPQPVLPASAKSLNRNGRLALATADGATTFSPTNTNADFGAGAGYRLGSGVAFAKVASA